jgi:hypothetical protein
MAVKSSIAHAPGSSPLAAYIIAQRNAYSANVKLKSITISDFLLGISLLTFAREH